MPNYVHPWNDDSPHSLYITIIIDRAELNEDREVSSSSSFVYTQQKDNYIGTGSSPSCWFLRGWKWLSFQLCVMILANDTTSWFHLLCRIQSLNACCVLNHLNRKIGLYKSEIGLVIEIFCYQTWGLSFILSWLIFRPVRWTN